MNNKKEKKMFTSKQRSNLKKIASTIEPIAQIGKGGVSENMAESIKQALRKREIVKISVLNNCDEPIDALAEEIALKTESEVIYVIGKKIALYKKSDKDGVKHIEF